MGLFNLSSQSYTLIKCVFICCMIPLYFILEANNQYWQMIPSRSNIKIGFIVLLLISAAFLVLQFLIKRESAIMIVCWMAFNYLYFWLIYKAIISISFLSFLKPYKFYLPLLLFLTIFYSFWMLKTRIKYLVKLVSYVSVLLFLLLSVEFYRAFNNAGTAFKTSSLLSEKLKLLPMSSVEKPDVFLIVMDEYAGFRPLTQRYKFDNSEFANKLEADGFFVAKNPTSNYNGTLFSTLSLLNLTYLDTASLGDLKSPKAYSKAAKAIEENLLFEFFRANGYKVVNNSFLRIKQTPTKPFLILPIEDRLITNKTFGNILQGDLLLNLPSNKIQFLLSTFYAKSDSYNQKVITQIKRDIADSPSPLFTYTHLMMPHSPYVRDENGNLRKFSDAHQELKSKQYGDSYILYLRYCNKVIEQITDSILAVRQRAIIILVSDHGNRFMRSGQGIDDNFSNFIAVYSYDKNYKGFTDSVSLVNIFRLLMNNQFGQKLNILPNYQINVTEGVLN